MFRSCGAVPNSGRLTPQKTQTGECRLDFCMLNDTSDIRPIIGGYINPMQLSLSTICTMFGFKPNQFYKILHFKFVSLVKKLPLLLSGRTKKTCSLLEFSPSGKTSFAYFKSDMLPSDQIPEPLVLVKDKATSIPMRRTKLERKCKKVTPGKRHFTW